MSKSESPLVRRVLNVLARCISYILLPPLTFLYSFYLLSSFSGNEANKFGIFITGLIFGAILPIIIFLFLMKFKIVSDPDASIQRERDNIYLMGIILILLGGGILLHLKADSDIIRFWFNNLMILFAIYIINKFYKISAHLISLTATFVPLYFTNILQLTPIILLILLLSWARLYLRQHTVGQVVLAIFVSGIITLISFRII